MFFFGGEKKHEAKGVHCWGGETVGKPKEAIVYFNCFVMWLPLHGKRVLFCGLEHLALIFRGSVYGCEFLVSILDKSWDRKSVEYQISLQLCYRL